MKTSEKIKRYLGENQQASVNELVDFLRISRVAVSKQLSNLLAQDEIAKIGKPPVVFYLLKEQEISQGDTFEIDKNVKKIIEENFLFITPNGQRSEGLDGFQYWCVRIKQSIEKVAPEYVETLKKYNSFKERGLIDDAVGSGATLNETALQIKQKKIAKNVIGLAIAGSFKGFDVISEV